jgi:hypothetical protein
MSMTTAEALALADEVRSRRSLAKVSGRIPTTFERSTPAGSQLDKLMRIAGLAKAQMPPDLARRSAELLDKLHTDADWITFADEIKAMKAEIAACTAEGRGDRLEKRLATNDLAKIKAQADELQKVIDEIRPIIGQMADIRKQLDEYLARPAPGPLERFEMARQAEKQKLTEH